MEVRPDSPPETAAAGAIAGEPRIEARELLDAAATELQAHHGCACAWWQLTSFIDVHGPDAASFLDGIATQDMAGIAPNCARHALFLTSKARIIAPAMAYRASEERFLLELDPRRSEVLVTHLQRYRLRSRVDIGPLDLGAISLVGPGSAAAAAELDIEGHAGGIPAWFASPAWGVDSRTMLGSRKQVHALTGELEQRGEPGMADPEALDAIRIDAGVPALNDLLVGSMPAEVGGMEHAVALDKGCYLGQEPVARLHYRGRANRTLRQVELEQDLPEEYFESLMVGDEPGGDYLSIELPDAADDQRPVGTLTSWAHRADGSITGLAVLRREVEPGQRLRMRGTPVMLAAR